MALSQNDPAWSRSVLGFGPSTIGAAGCFLTAFANVLRWAGRGDINPANLNEIMKQNRWFTGDLVAQRQVPSLVAPTLLEWAGETQWAGPTDMNFFNDANDPNVAYIVWIWIQGNQDNQHFTMVWAKEGDDLIIDDSWDGVRKRLSVYGKPSYIIQAAYKFRKKNVSPVVNQPVTGGSDPDMAAPTRAEVIAIYQGVAGRTPSEQEINFHAANSSYKSLVNGLMANGDTAVVRLNNANQQINGQAGEINSLRAQLADLAGRPAQSQLDDLVAKLASSLDENTRLKTENAQIETLKQELATLKAAAQNTPTTKSARTFLQGIAAVITIGAGAFALPEVQAFLSNPINAGGAIVLLTPVATYIMNKWEEYTAKKAATEAVKQ